MSNSEIKLIKRVSVGCLILSKDGKILLQQRDADSPTFPGCLATFGGGVEEGELALQALVRELKEELGAQVDPAEVVSLGVFTEAQSNHNEVVYAYYWQDKQGTITGCYEGQARYYNSENEIEQHPKLMSDVRWMLKECHRRKLIL